MTTNRPLTPEELVLGKLFVKKLDLDKELESLFQEIENNPNQLSLLDQLDKGELIEAKDQNLLAKLSKSENILNRISKIQKELSKQHNINLTAKNYEQILNDIKSLKQKLNGVIKRQKDKFSRSQTSKQVLLDGTIELLTETTTNLAKRGKELPQFLHEFTADDNKAYEVINSGINLFLPRGIFQAPKKKIIAKSKDGALFEGGLTLDLTYDQLYHLAGIKNKSNADKSKFLKTLDEFGNKKWAIATENTKTGKKRLVAFKAWAPSTDGKTISFTFTEAFLKSLGQNNFVIAEPLHHILDQNNKRYTKHRRIFYSLLIYWHGYKERDKDQYYRIISVDKLCQYLDLKDTEKNKLRPQAKRTLKSTLETFLEIGILNNWERRQSQNDGSEQFYIEWNPNRFEGRSRAVEIKTDWCLTLEALLKKAKSKAALASALGISRSTLYKWIKGEDNPSPPHQKELNDLNKIWV